MLLNTKHNLVKCIIISFSVIEKKKRKEDYIESSGSCYILHIICILKLLDCYFVCLDTVVEDATRMCIHTCI